MMKVMLLIGTALVLLISCSGDTVTPSTDECDGMSFTYTDDVKPILDTHCATAGCHNATSRANGLDYSSYESVKSKAGNGNFLGSIRHEGGFKAMPLGGSKISNTKIMTLSCWIASGFPE